MIPERWQVDPIIRGSRGADDVARDLSDMPWLFYSLALYLQRPSYVQRWVDQIEFLDAQEIRRRTSFDIELPSPWEHADLFDRRLYSPGSISPIDDIVLPVSHQAKQAFKGFSATTSLHGQGAIEGRVPPSDYTNFVSASWMSILISSLDETGSVLSVGTEAFERLISIASLPAEQAKAQFDAMFGNGRGLAEGERQIWNFCRSFATGFPLIVLVPAKTDSVLVKVEFQESLLLGRFRSFRDVLDDQEHYKFASARTERDCASYHCEVNAPEDCVVSEFVARKRRGGPERSVPLCTRKSHFHLGAAGAPGGAELQVVISAHRGFRGQLLGAQTLALLSVALLTWGALQYGQKRVIERWYFDSDPRVVLITVLVATILALHATVWRHEVTEVITTGSRINVMVTSGLVIIIAAAATLWTGSNARLTALWGPLVVALALCWAWTVVGWIRARRRNSRAAKFDDSMSWFRAS